MNKQEARWDTDTIGHGVADGQALVPGVQRLLDALQLASWVAEDPDAHLLPHLRRVGESAAAPWKLTQTQFADGVYEVNLEWLRRDANLAALRADIFSLVGAIAEGVTYVHQQVTPQQIVYEVITGMLDGETQFRGHGHIVRFVVEGEPAHRLLALMRGPRP